MKKRYSLSSQNHCLGQFVHLYTISLAIRGITECDFVPESIVVMARHIVDGLTGRGREIVDAALYSPAHHPNQPPCPCREPFRRPVKGVSNQVIAEFVVEDGQSQSLLPSFEEEFGSR